VDPVWAPDGKRIAYGRTAPLEEGLAIQILDLDTRRVKTLPGSENLYSPRWSPDGRYLAASTPDSKKLLIYDFETQKWSDWRTEKNGVVAWMNWSPDSKYLYYDRLLTEPATFRRIRVGSTNSEVVIDLKNLRKLYEAPVGGAWFGIAPDGSPLFSRDLSTDEIYGLDLSLP
jgi:Tol biopolymer transport system component